MRSIFKSAAYLVGFGILNLHLVGCTTITSLSDPDFEPTIPDMPEPKVEADGSLFHAGSNRYLFEDIKATRVGDLLTVVLIESTNASKSSSFEADKTVNVDLPQPTLFGKDNHFRINGNQILENSVSATRDISGEGDLEQENSLSGNVTVTVARVLSNGYLVIKGEKLITLNEGSEVVRISGLVRPNDVRSDNTVDSTQIANAKITYKGDGAVSNSSKASWLYRFFSSPVWPI